MEDAGRAAGMLEALIVLDGHAESFDEKIPSFLGMSVAALPIPQLGCSEALAGCTSGDGVCGPWTLRRIHDIDDDDRLP